MPFSERGAPSTGPAAYGRAKVGGRAVALGREPDAEVGNLLRLGDVHLHVAGEREQFALPP
ncbi:hypothetical protein WP39_28360 [Streptomyces sp. 604F]|nr:hypothetical protein [Streptomyces sp. 604F]